MTSRTTTPLPPRRPTIRGRDVFASMLLAVVMLAALFGAARFTAVPPHVERVEFVNPTVYDIDVDVTGGDRDGWVGAGIARRTSTTVVQEVLDQGDTWTFRFRAQGEDGGELTLPRVRLERDDRKVRVPSRVADDLESRGASPPP